MNKSISNSNYFLEYGLEKDPFPVDVIDKNIFLTPEINRRLKNAKQHILEAQKVLLVTSVSGAGKSLLAQKLIILKESDWRTGLICADVDMSSESLAYALIQQLLPEDNINIEQSISMLHRYLEHSYKESVRPVIVIDDADKLPKETLQFLFQLADLKYNEAFFRIVLFAHESINETIAKVGVKELAEGMIEYMSMPSFTLDQVPVYLKYKLSSCGNDIEIPFAGNDIEYIHKVSSGLPGGINTLSRKIMQDALSIEKPGKNFGILPVLFSLILLVLASYLYYENYASDDFKNSFQREFQMLPEAIRNQGNVLAGEHDREEDVALNENEWTQISELDESLSLKLSDVLSTNKSDSP
jgi:type II secretory pathway predicted ATPase ExeA